MKKNYIIPAVQVNETQAASMMAVSLQSGKADKDSEVLSKEDCNWDIWEE